MAGHLGKFISPPWDSWEARGYFNQLEKMLAEIDADLPFLLNESATEQECTQVFNRLVSLCDWIQQHRQRIFDALLVHLRSYEVYVAVTDMHREVTLHGPTPSTGTCH